MSKSPFQESLKQGKEFGDRWVRNIEEGEKQLKESGCFDKLADVIKAIKESGIMD